MKSCGQNWRTATLRRYDTLDDQQLPEYIPPQVITYTAEEILENVVLAETTQSRLESNDGLDS